MMPSCEAVIMSNRTYLSNEWKEDPCLTRLCAEKGNSDE